MQNLIAGGGSPTRVMALVLADNHRTLVHHQTSYLCIALYFLISYLDCWSLMMDKYHLKCAFLLYLQFIDKWPGIESFLFRFGPSLEQNLGLPLLIANGRRRRNLIKSLKKRLVKSMQSDNGLVHLQEEKESLILQHFESVMGTVVQRHETLNRESLQIQRHELPHDLEDEFTEGEIKTVVMDTESEKAPGPDGYIGKFFKTCWGTIKHYVRKHQRRHIIRRCGVPTHLLSHIGDAG